MKNLFDGKAVFETPKPSELIEMAIKIGASDGIVLDFFAGSASTAEAVIKSGKNKYILVQLPELCDVNSEAYKSGLKTLADISKDRIKRVLNKNDARGGFKTLRLTSSNYKKWNDIKEGNITQLENSLDLFNGSPLREDWSKNKLMSELMLLEGFPLDATQTKSAISSNEIIKVESEMVPNILLICLDDEIEESLIDKLELDNASTFICLDSAISNQNKLRLSDKGLIKTI